jgi:hypothetical protein
MRENQCLTSRAPYKEQVPCPMRSAIARGPRFGDDGRAVGHGPTYGHCQSLI